MIAASHGLIEKLQRHRGVFGVMLVGIDDGRVIAGDAGAGRDTDAAGALAASLFRRTRIAAGEAGLGDVSFVRLEAGDGHLCATPRGDLVVVTVSGPHANIGRLRIDMLSAAEPA